MVTPTVHEILGGPHARNTETYRNGLVRPTAMANLPDRALREFLARHAGPALEAARDEAEHRGWTR